MKKPDFSKAAIQGFFLYHSEKLILATAVVLLGVFFWMGFKTKPFTEKSPAELSQLADRADQYIRSPASWDSIKDFRSGKKDVADVVRAGGGIDPSWYEIVPITGIAARTLDPRTDPKVLGPTELEAQVFTAPLIASLNRPLVQDQFAEYPSAAGLGPEADEPVTGFGASGDMGDEDEDYDEDDVGDSEPSGAGGKSTSGAFGGIGGVGGNALVEEDTRPRIDGHGTQMQVVNVHTFPGMRPPVHSIPASQSKAGIFDVVVVTGLVDIQQQSAFFESSFSTGVGYFPNRDKPIYQYVQVERREVDKPGQPVAGKAGEWSDQSELISFNVPSAFPYMHQMPKAFYPTAPDNVAPENWDPILTGPIPSVVMFDYLPFINHSKLAAKTRTFPKPLVEQEREEVNPLDVFTTGGGNVQSGFGGTGGFGGPAGGGSGKGVGAPGGGAPGGIVGRPGGGGPPQAGGKGGMGGGGGRVGSPMGGGGFGGASMEVKQTRSGTDFTDYIKALDAKKTNAKFRLVRFFDVLAQPGKTYEYRMRLWIGDPNNEDLNQEFASRQGGVPTMSRLASDDSEDEGDEEEDEEDDAGFVSSTGRQMTVGNQEPEAVYVSITSSMKHPNVRKRLNRAREVRDPKTGLSTYFVSEVTGQDADGKDIIEEVEVPRVAIGRDQTGATVYASYLRYARPSPWSDPVTVTVNSHHSQVAGGQVEPPRKARVKVGNKDIELPISEPKAEVAASVWWKKDLGTALPTRQTVYRGDALDFYAPSYFLHPVTWNVHVAKNDSATEGDVQYLVPIETGKVVVDALGGEELALPRTEKMRFNVASEVLVMDEFGQFTVKNDMDDSTSFRNMLFLPDDSQTVGKLKIKKPKRGREESTGGGGKGFSSDEDDR